MIATTLLRLSAQKDIDTDGSFASTMVRAALVIELIDAYHAQRTLLNEARETIRSYSKDSDGDLLDRIDEILK